MIHGSELRRRQCCHAGRRVRVEMYVDQIQFNPGTMAQ
jgi:hypothetical protein